MAPEQYEGRPVHARADLYSLGCTLHALLTGRPPFTGSPAALMHQHLTAVPPRLSDLRPDAPPELDRVIAQLPAKTPATGPPPRPTSPPPCAAFP